VLRTNLSTRPFYNERIVHAVAAVVGVLVLAVAAWQIARVIQLSRYKTELNGAIRRDKGQIEYLTREAGNVRRGLDQKQLTLVATEAKEANTLIEKRTFSWTQLFNQLEATLPEDVMLTSVRPEFAENGVTRVSMEIQGRGGDVIDSFWEKLEKTGAFHDIEWSGLTVSEEGIHRVQMSAVYTGAAR
jgi:Tfp pilus assembly protein PilN